MARDLDSGSSASPFNGTDLPSLGEAPKVHPGCCLSLSEPLLSYLHSSLPSPPQLVLSIGSGAGLLEALLLRITSPKHIIGLEVHPNPNRYLPPASIRQVNGSRDLHPIASTASAWLFVYPKRVGLVQEYLAKLREEQPMTVVWVGPQADWEDYRGSFDGAWNLDIKSADEVGGRAWELIAIACRKPAKSDKTA